MIPGEWYYPILLVDAAWKLPAEVVNEGGYETFMIEWPTADKKHFVICAVQQAGYEILKKLPKYVTDNLDDLRDKFGAQLTANLKDAKTLSDGKVNLPGVFAGQTWKYPISVEPTPKGISG